MTLDELYDILSDPDNGVSVEITEDQNIVINAREDLIPVLIEQGIAQAVEKLVYLSLELGMFLPEEVFSTVKKYVDGEEK